MRHGSLFSGIGGFDLAAQWMGWENVFQVEIDPFCQKVLEKNFPNTKRYGDIKQFDGSRYKGAIDVLTGGPPCQPVSRAGKRKGDKDDRWKWPEAIRVFGEVRPRVAVFETPSDNPIMENTQLQTTPKESAFASMQTFEHAQRVAKMLASSSLVPKEYVNRVDNCLIALEMSNRIGASPLMVMQNLHIIQGKPSWSSPFIIASINTCGRFGKLGFRKSGEGDDYGYEAFAKDKEGNECVGPKVTWKMVKSEGWFEKSGSKWKTMPELMFQYRSAAFFGRLHCPDILMGMQTSEEVIDVVATTVETVQVDKEAERLKQLIADAKTVDDLTRIEEHVTPELWDLFSAKMTELKAVTVDPAQQRIFV